jgi:hypothetical protein
MVDVGRRHTGSVLQAAAARGIPAVPSAWARALRNRGFGIALFGMKDAIHLAERTREAGLQAELLPFGRLRDALLYEARISENIRPFLTAAGITNDR